MSVTALAGDDDRPPRARSIVAAARRLDLSKTPDLDLLKRREGDGWIDEAWTYWDAVPEVKSTGRFLAHAMSRLRFYPGVVVDPDEPPLFVDDATKVERFENPDDVLDAEVAAAAVEELERVSNQREGQAGLLRSWAVQLFVPGDSYLVAEDRGEGEDWQVYAPSAITTVDGPDNKPVPAVKETPNAKARALESADGDEPIVIRIWRRHDRWPGWSDSPMRSLLDVCEELLIWARMFRGIARTRNSNGFLLIPSELDFEELPRRGDEDEEGEDGPADALTKLERDVLESMIKPLEDESTPSGVAPHIIRGKAEYLKEFRHVAVDRKVDEYVVGRLAALVERFARSTDLPPEVVLGIGDVNHWGSWQIEDATYKTGVEPTAAIPAWGLGSAWLRPALLDRFTPEGADGPPEDKLRAINRIVVGIDPSALVSRPNQGQDAKDAYDREALGDAGLRRRLGIGDTEAPSEEELLRRILMNRGVLDATMTEAILRRLKLIDAPIPVADPGAPPSDEEEPADAEQDQPTPEEPDVEGEEPVAAASRAAVGERLAAIDGRLRDRLQVAAGAAVEQALRRAGNNLRGRAQGDAELARQLKGLDPAVVGRVVGEERAAGLAPVDDLLDPGSFDGLAGQWDAWVSNAQAAVVTTLMAEAPDAQVGDAAAAEYEAGSTQRRQDGWAALLAALLAIARGRLFTADEDEPLGEVDPSVPVPAGPVRDALALAGGGGGPGVPGGVATGPAARRAVLRLGQVVQAWEWRLGAPTRPFEPHQRLSGTVFRDFDDERLRNGSGWPSFSHYFPGDHKGCQCDAVPIIVPAASLP